MQLPSSFLSYRPSPRTGFSTFSSGIMQNGDITIVIPTIAPRASRLLRAVKSVVEQYYPAGGLIVTLDSEKEGAATTRQRGLDQVRTPWVAFLDDDDEFLPDHLGKLLTHAHNTKADYVYSWYEVNGGEDPRPEVFGQPFDPDSPVQTTVTTLVRTTLAQEAGFVDPSDAPLSSPDRLYAGEDWYFTQRCLSLGAQIEHLPERTWVWHHHEANTSGLPSRW